MPGYSSGGDRLERLVVLYDANDNMISRVNGLNTDTLSYDAENRLTNVTGSTNASFVYDGDGKWVKGTVGNVSTFYAGSGYEYST